MFLAIGELTHSAQVVDRHLAVGYSLKGTGDACLLENPSQQEHVSLVIFDLKDALCAHTWINSSAQYTPGFRSAGLFLRVCPQRSAFLVNVQEPTPALGLNPQRDHFRRQWHDIVPGI
jgi:hypothetical protein